MLLHHSPNVMIYDMHQRVNVRWMRPIFPKTVSQAHIPNIPMKVQLHRHGESQLRLQKKEHLHHALTSLSMHRGLEEMLFILTLFYLEMSTQESTYVELKRFNAVDRDINPPIVLLPPPLGIFVVSKENILGGNILAEYDMELNANHLAMFKCPTMLSLGAHQVLNPHLREGYVDLILFS